MKTLYILRHADAVKAKNKKDDKARTLSKNGKEAARFLAKKISQDGDVGLILSSSAERAHATAKFFSKSTKPEGAIEARDDLYDRMTVITQMNVIKKLDNKYNSAMLVGHIPNLEEIVSHLLKNVKASIPACGLVCLEFNKNAWSTITKGSASLKFIDFPVSSFKNKEKKTFRKNLAAQIIVDVQKHLTTTNSVAAKKFSKYVKGSADKLSRRFMKEVKSIRLEGDAAVEALNRKADKKATAPRKATAKAATSAVPRAPKTPKIEVADKTSKASDTGKTKP